MKEEHVQVLISSQSRTIDGHRETIIALETEVRELGDELRQQKAYKGILRCYIIESDEEEGIATQDAIAELSKVLNPDSMRNVMRDVAPLERTRERYELDQHLFSLIGVDPKGKLDECGECEDQHSVAVVRGLCIGCAAKRFDIMQMTINGFMKVDEESPEMTIPRTWIHSAELCQNEKRLELLTLIRDQYNTALTGTSPNCACCDKKIPWHKLFKCYLCSLWLCERCSNRHFGGRLGEGGHQPEKE